MKVTVLTLVLLALCAGLCWGIGYTVFTRDLVSPMYTTIDGTGGTTVQVLNPGDTPAYPATFRTLVCRPPAFSIYSSNPSRRKETWEDTAGTATANDITDACGPLWNSNNASSISEAETVPTADVAAALCFACHERRRI